MGDGTQATQPTLDAASSTAGTDCLDFGLTLMWLASKPCSRVITAHRIRAFLLAIAMQAFCQPMRAVSWASLAAAGVLTRHDAEPGAELLAILELLEVADAYCQARCPEFADADHLCSTSGCRVGPHMQTNLPVAPVHVLIKLTPMLEGSLQNQTRRRAEIVARVLDDVGQY